MWILCDAENKFYCCLRGAGPDDGPDWQARCMLWFRSQEAAEQFFDDKTKHSNNLIVLVPRQMGNQWRKVLQTSLHAGLSWIVGVGYQDGRQIRSSDLSIQDLLEGRFPKGLMARTSGLMDVEDQKRLAGGRIESTAWASCGEVFIEASLVPRFAKDHGLGEDVVATKLMVLAKVNVERLKEAGEMSFGQSEMIHLDGVVLHTLILDGKVFVSDVPFFPYDTPPAIHGLTPVTRRPEAHDGQNRTGGRINE